MLDRDFFIKYQRVLVWLFNTRFGRYFFRIRKKGIKVVAVFPSAITWLEGFKKADGEWRVLYKTGFKTRNVYAFRLNALLRYFPFIRWERNWVPQLQVGLTVTSFFPDAHIETDTVDGWVERQSVDETWTTIRTSAGNNHTDSDDQGASVHIQASTTSNQYWTMRRGIFLFDTSNIGSDTVDSAKFIFDTPVKTNGLSGDTHDNSRIVFVASTPNANDDLVNADYGQLGSTSFGESAKQADLVAQNNEIVLNGDGLTAIVTDGISKFGTRYKWDFGNTETGLTWTSNGVQRIYIDMAEVGGANRAELEITHSSVAGTSKMLMGVGS